MMRWRLIFIAFLLIVSSLLFLRWIFCPTEPFPHIWLRIPIKILEVRVMDLEGDGSDEVTCYDWQGKKGWLLKWQHGRIRLQPLQPFPFTVTRVPLAGTISEAMWEERYVVGRTKQKDIAVAELQLNGQWRVISLAQDAISYSIGDLDGDGHKDDIVFLTA